MDLLIGRKLLILVADSCKKTRLLILYHLGQWDHNVQVVDNADHLIKLYFSMIQCQKKPDIVILDYELYFKKGIRAFKRLMQMDREVNLLLLDKNKICTNSKNFETNNIKIVPGYPYQGDWKGEFLQTIGSIVKTENTKQYEKNLI